MFLTIKACSYRLTLKNFRHQLKNGTGCIVIQNYFGGGSEQTVEDQSRKRLVLL